MPKPTAFVRKRHEYDDVYSLWFRNPGLSYEAGRYAHVLVGECGSATRFANCRSPRLRTRRS